LQPIAHNLILSFSHLILPPFYASLACSSTVFPFGPAFSQSQGAGSAAASGRALLNGTLASPSGSTHAGATSRPRQTEKPTPEILGS